MPIRGIRNPFPKKETAKPGVFNTGPGPKMIPENRSAVKEAYKNTNSKSGHGDTGASAGAVRKHVFADHTENGHGQGHGSAGGIRATAMGSSRKGGGGGQSAKAVRAEAMGNSRKRG